MTQAIALLQLRIGRLQNLGFEQVQTGIFKTCVASAYLNESGLEGDVHGDTRHHGGPEKALHHYASEHYPWLRQQLPEPAAGHCDPGAFGENLVTRGITEADVCIGDVYQLGDARLEVSQPRQPCWRLNQRFGIADMSARLQSSLKTGWYYRVLKPGLIKASDSLTLEQRPNPGWPLLRVLRCFYEDTLDRRELKGLAKLSQLSANWRIVAENRLQTGEVEDWNGRLYGPLQP